MEFLKDSFSLIQCFVTVLGITLLPFRSFVHICHCRTYWGQVGRGGISISPTKLTLFPIDVSLIVVTLPKKPFVFSVFLIREGRYIIDEKPNL